MPVRTAWTTPLLTALLAAALAPGAAARTSEPRIPADRARVARIGGTLSPQAQERLAAADFWGGRLTASTGEQVTVFMSDSYPRDAASSQRWAELFARLVHGPELSTLEAYVLPLTEVQSYCGRRALACYSPRSSSLVTPGDAPYPDTPAESIAAHEYGHHIAASRDNAPWEAVDYGTKRWASYLNICARSESGELNPGDEGDDYSRNPGEGFAEAYRVLNEQKLGLTQAPWEIVSTTFQPDATALALLEQDVTQPWAQPAASTYRGTSGRRYTFATALDGALRVTVRAAARTRVRLEVSQNGRRVARTTTIAGGGRSSTLEICGERSAQVRVTRVAGRGGYTLTVAKP